MIGRTLFNLLILVGLGMGIETTRAAEPLAYYGYYHAQTVPFGLLMEEAGGFTNVILLETARYEDIDDIFDKQIGIPRAIELGMQVILGFEGFLLDTQQTPEIYEDLLGLTSLKLREAGYLDSKYILAVYLSDEPPNFGISVEDQELALEIAERYFPGIPKMINYSIGQVRNPGIPIAQGLDLVAFDAYYFQTSTASELSQPALDAFLESGMSEIRRKAPGKPVFLIGQSFQAKPFGYFMPSNQQMDWYVDYARKTPEIVGLLWFMLGSGKPGGEGEFLEGVFEFPEQLEHQRQIGRQLAPELFRLDQPQSLPFHQQKQ